MAALPPRFSLTPTQKSLGLVVVLCVVYFSELWLHPGELLYWPTSDVTWLHYPFRLFAAESFQAHGTIPLWCPYANSGQPFQADLHSTLFYPPHFLFYVCPTSAVGSLIGWLVWAHVLVAGVSMFAYARANGLSQFGAIVAAVGFMFAGKWLLHVLQGGHVIFLPMAWFPLLLLFLERSIKTRSLSSAALAGLFGALILTGSHPQLTVYAGLLAGVCAVRTFLETIRESRHDPAAPRFWARAGHVVLCLSFAGLVGVGLGAVQILPSLELTPLTSRAHDPSLIEESNAHYSFYFHNLREFAMRGLSLMGPQYFNGNAWENVGAFGVLWSTLAFLAVLFRPAKNGFWGLCLLFLIVFAIGGRTPVYHAVCQVLPPLQLFRIPIRILLFAGLPLGMLVGRLSEDLWLSDSSLPQRLRWTSGVVVLLIVGLYWWASHQPSGPTYSYWSVTLVLGGLLVAVCFLPQSWATGKMARVLAVGILVGDLWGLHWNFVDTKSLAEIYPENDVVAALNQDRSDYRVLDSSPVDKNVLSPTNQGMCFRNGIERIRGENPTELHQYGEFIQLSVNQKSQLFDFLRVKYYVLPAQPTPGGFPPGDWRHVGDYTQTKAHNYSPEGSGIQDPGPYSVFERTAELPGAWVVPEIQPAGKTNETLHAQLLQADLYKTAFFEDPTREIRHLEPEVFHNTQNALEIHVTRSNPDQILVELSEPRYGGLVLSDVWYPGWTCIDETGNELPVYRANGLFRAVKLSGTERQLTFRFEPKSYRIGSWISFGTLLALCVATVWTSARPKMRLNS